MAVGRLTSAGHARQWPRSPRFTLQGAVSIYGQISEQICTKGKWCFVPAGQSSIIIKDFRSNWDLFLRYFPQIFFPSLQTCFGLCSLILAKSSSLPNAVIHSCFLYTVWLSHIWLWLGTLNHMLYMASQSDLLIFLDLNTKKKNQTRGQDFSNNKPGTTHFLFKWVLTSI